MAGKGSSLRKGANLNAYWNNYPFPEKLTVTQWVDKLGEKDVDMSVFKNIPIGSKITEEQYYSNVKYIEKSPDGNSVHISYQEPKVEEYILTTSELEQLKDDMSSMSFSEFQKIKKK